MCFLKHLNILLEIGFDDYPFAANDKLKTRILRRLAGQMAKTEKPDYPQWLYVLRMIDAEQSNAPVPDQSLS